MKLKKENTYFIQKVEILIIKVWYLHDDLSCFLFVNLFIII